ncbi:hypothetical protein [Mycolicibacterium insubricum]|nr:hypothetical protein [Mycolicibacterium insubricum]MCV7080001.1 hypothetical protein [Mycolicibacterium insubricum]
MNRRNTPEFARAIRAAFESLEISQAEFRRRGGPTDTTLRKIMDDQELVGIAPRTLSMLDAGFGWPPGAAANVLSGGVPPAPQRSVPTAPTADPLGRSVREQAALANLADRVADPDVLFELALKSGQISPEDYEKVRATFDEFTIGQLPTVFPLLSREGQLQVAQLAVRLRQHELLHRMLTGQDEQPEPGAAADSTASGLTLDQANAEIEQLRAEIEPSTNNAFLRRLAAAKALESAREALDVIEREASREESQQFADTAGIDPYFVEEWTTRLSVTNDAVQRIAQAAATEDGIDSRGLNKALSRIDDLLHAGHELAQEVRDKDIHATAPQLRDLPPVLAVGSDYLSGLDDFLTAFDVPEALDYTKRVVGARRAEIKHVQDEFAEAHRVLYECGLTSEPPSSSSSEGTESAAGAAKPEWLEAFDARMDAVFQRSASIHPFVDLQDDLVELRRAFATTIYISATQTAYVAAVKQLLVRQLDRLRLLPQRPDVTPEQLEQATRQIHWIDRAELLANDPAAHRLVAVDDQLDGYLRRVDELAPGAGLCAELSSRRAQIPDRESPAGMAAYLTLAEEVLQRAVAQLDARRESEEAAALIVEIEDFVAHNFTRARVGVGSSDEAESAAAGLREHRERLREVQDGDHGAEQPG